MDIEAKIKAILDDPEQRKTFLGYDELDTSPKKLIDCPYEIVFVVEANIMQQNEKHENVNSKMIHKTTFHMPVPEGDDALEYMNTFLKHFEQCLIQTKKQELNNG